MAGGIFGRLVMALAGAALAAGSVPASAQLYSEGYKFLQAVKDKKGEEVTALLDAPGSTVVNSRDLTSGDTGLHLVVQRRDLVWLNFLAQKGANPNIRNKAGVTPLMLAAQRARTPEIFEALAQAGASPDLKNNEGMTALMIAAGSGNVEGIKNLVALSADLSVGDADGVTPLIHAILARDEDPEAIGLLIRSGSDVNVSDAGRTSPLMHAAFRGRTETAKLLLDAGARPDAADAVGWTPMHFAARSAEGADVVRLLLDRGCPADPADNGGTTPVMVAASYNNAEAVRMLIEAGADHTRADHTGRNAYEYALLKNAPDSKKAIEEVKEQKK